MKIAIFLPNWIGDAVMATPTLRAVRTKFADAEIIAVMRPYVAEVLNGLDLVDRHLLHEPRVKGSRNRGWGFVKRLRQERIDLALLLPNSQRCAWLARLSGATRRVGFDRDGRGWLLTNRIRSKPKSEPNPVIDEYLRLAAHLGCRELSRHMELATTRQDERQLDEFWSTQQRGLRRNGVICLNPGGAYGSAKHWPTASFGKLARKAANAFGKTILVLCGPQEREDAHQIAANAAHPHVVSLAEFPLSLGLTKAAVKHSDLLVTTDSGPRHFAPPLGIPVVTLFGPTHIAWSETGYDRALHLQIEVDCGPCQRRTCPLGHHKCMTELSVERVFSAVASVLEWDSTKGSAA